MSDKYPGGFVTAGAPAGFSVAFDGNGDSVTAPQGSSFQFPADFTIECWVFANSSTGGASYDGVFDTRSGNVASSNSAGINYKPDGYLNMYVGGNNAASSVLLGASRWTHVALVRSGSAVTMYQNGISVATTTTSANLSDGYCTIGGFVAAGYWNGYISNVRVVKGTALYTTTFTPPTQLFPVTNTQLLTCQSPTIIDNSGNSVVLTVNGNAAASNFTPFAGYQGFNPALGAAAGGVWTLDEAAYYQQNRLWPLYDPYFNQTTLMLHGNGTNAAQNNTFLDSSTNNFTITRNGNTTQGSFSPFSQTGWSNNFASSAALSVDYTSNLQLQNTNWTIEAYFNLSSASAEFCVMGASNGGGGVPKYFMGGNWNTSFGYAANRATFFTYTSGGNRFIDVPFTWEIGRWYHMAAVYTHSNTTVTLYINGVSVGSIAYGIDSCTGAVLIARNGEGGGILTGYISNFRYMVGTSLYTSNFTPSTQPLTALTNTQILTCQSNRFVDNSASNRVINIFAAGVSVQAFSPFVPAYITPTTYSNWFDGTGDYLTAPNAAWMDLGTGSFTMECWVQFNTVASTQMIVSSNYNAGTGGGGWAFLYRQDNTTLKFSCNSNVSYEKTWSPAAGTMYHVAVCRSGTDLRLFVNGTQLGTTSTSTDNISGSSLLFVGSNVSNPLPINGVISNLRIVTSALYTANFTPPTAPLTNIANTQFLSCQSSTFVDNSTNAATLTAYGNVQPVTSPTPFPAKVDTTTLNSAYSTSLIGGSAYFDGSGDSLSLSSTSLNLSSSDFTIETWVYATTTDRDCIIGSISDAAGLSAWMLMTNEAGSPYRFYCRYNGGSTLNYLVGSGNFPVNQWTHFAVTRNGANVRIFINGIQIGTTNTSLGANSIDNATAPYYFGRTTDDTANFTGYLSGTRVVVGTALYTQNFAPPVIPPTVITNTTLLTNFTNGAIFDNTAKNVLETINNAQISTSQSKWGGSSMYFDGTGDRVQISPNTSQSVVLGTGDFTIELWVYFNALPSGDLLLVGGNTNAAYLIANSSGQIRFGTYNVNWIIGPGGTMTTNTWYHVAVTRSGTTVNLFLNGVPVVSSVSSSQNFSAASYVIGGDQVGGVTSLNGYIDDLRITKAARYVANFTPPTSQLQDQ